MQLNIDSPILNVAWWNLALCWRLRGSLSLFLRLWHMSCWAGRAPLCLPLSLHPTAREWYMLCFYALRSLLVLSSHCNTAVFQHNNNWDCGGSSPPHRVASHPGMTTCQATLSLYGHNYTLLTLWCQPFLLMIHRSCWYTWVYIGCHVLSIPACTVAAVDICMCTNYAIFFTVSITEAWLVWRAWVR